MPLGAKLKMTIKNAKCLKIFNVVPIVRDHFSF
jgi:hypothetical protein